jgi:enoyl-CoA hydratase/carnithine racemase
MIDALHKELTEMDEIGKLRAVIISHEGPAFSAGHDLRQLVCLLQRIPSHLADDGERHRLSSRCVREMHAVVDVDSTHETAGDRRGMHMTSIVTAIAGAWYGGGCGMSVGRELRYRRCRSFSEIRRAWVYD